MSEVENIDGCHGEEGADLSTSNGGQGVPTETATRVDDDINPEEDNAKTVESAHLPKDDDLPESEETAAIEEVPIEQPSTAEGGGEAEGQIVASSSEESLRYANPYGTFITGIDINSEVCASVRVCSLQFVSLLIVSLVRDMLYTYSTEPKITTSE